MVQLVQLRNRIKAIETIKKITHAMRLISMSSHSRLKHKEAPLHNYTQAITELFNKIQTIRPEWDNPILAPTTQEKNILVILIGSSKGLCGSFNSTLFHHLEWYAPEHKLDLKNVKIATIGKRSHVYVQEHHLGSLVTAYEELTTNSLISLAHKLTQDILTAAQPFSSVLVFSNFLKTFFVQKPQTSILIPFKNMLEESSEKISHQSLEEYRWEQQPEEILDILVQQCIEANLQHLLFQSLIAEHAARFLSMDNSTRNAKTLLEKTKLDYNKLRQAKITKELAELVGNF